MFATPFSLGRGTVGAETEDDGEFGRQREVGCSKPWEYSSWVGRGCC